MSAPMAPTGRAEDVRADRAKSGDDPPPREIVVGVDGTEVGPAAVRWAAQEAARRSAPLRILHAAPYLGRGGPAGAPPPELPRARGITAVAYTVARHTEPGVQSSTEVVTDDAVTALLRAAAAGQLVVMGSSATGAADEMVLAKLAAKVAGHSPAPVVVVPRRRGNEPAGRPVVAVLGVGEPADDDAVALFAADAAQGAGVPLSVLQTRASRSTASGSWVDDLTAWSERFPDLDVRHSDLPAARANQVLGEACPSPLMVISAGHGTLLHRSVDGPHLWMLRHCTSPMALIPAVHRSEHGKAAPPG
jgi:nucleotide-binding universal stress UspA family protein